MSYDALCVAVHEAWEAVPEHLLSQLLGTMQQRCLDVITANGMHTRW